MADGGQQRLLDVIDDVFSSDPNALESFLSAHGQCTSLESETFDILNIAGSGCTLDSGTRSGLTSTSDLLPSVDTVVASLAHSLAADYEVDSPNDTLFDNCLEASSNTLTDISQSYVPSDFDNANYSLSNGLSQQQHHELVSISNTSQQNQLSFCTAQTGTTTTVNSVGGGGTGEEEEGASRDINVLVNSTLQQQYGNSICDSTSTFVHSSQNTTTTTITTAATTTTEGAATLVNSSFNQQEQEQQNFSHLTDLQCTQPQNDSQIPSLSSTSSSTNNNNNNPRVVVNSIQNHNSSSSNINNDDTESRAVTTTTMLSSATNSSDLISPVSTVASNSSNNNNSNSRITTGIVSTFTQPASQQQQQQQITDVSQVSAQKNICGIIITNSAAPTTTTISTTTNNNCESPANNNISNNIHLQIQQQQQTLPQQQQQHQQQFIVSATQNINQLVSHQGQTVSLSSMMVSPQLMTTNSAGGLISSVIGSGHHQGTNLMQIQSAQGQQFITIEQPQTLNLGAFGTANLALVATGGGTQYAVLPTGSQIFSPKIHQAATGQTFFQTPSGSIVAANSIQGLQGVQNVNISNISTTSIRAKQPQLLPKPTTLNSVAAGGGTTVISNLTQPISNNNLTLCSSSGDNNISNSNNNLNGGVSEQLQQQQQHSVTVNNMGQIQIQQQPVHHQVQANNIVTSIGSNLSQSSFTIGNAPGLGQVMVSGVSNMNSMTQPQQAHLTGTIVLNQFGQPVLIPTAGNNNGLQTLILRQQQPAQPQVLTLGAPAAQATTGLASSACKPIVRYVPQMPQNQTVQIQQIQTSNGPAFIAVRCPPTTQTSPASFVSPQIQSSEPIISQQPIVQPSNNPSILHPHTINTIQQQTIGSITSQNQTQITIKTEKPDVVSQPQQQQQQVNSSAIPDSSSEIPPKKKPSKSKKKKVTLDLDEILKQSGIGDEDLQDDSCFENSLPLEQQQHVELMNGYQNIQQQPNNYLISAPEPIKPNGCLTKSQNLPVNILPPHVHVLKPSTHQPSNKNQRNSVNNNFTPGGAGSSTTTKKTPPPRPKSAPKRKAPAEKSPFESSAKQPNFATFTTPPPNKKNSSKTNNNISININNNNNSNNNISISINNNNSKKKKSNAAARKNSSPSTAKSPANSQKGQMTNNKTTPVPISSYTSAELIPSSTTSPMASAFTANSSSTPTSMNAAGAATNNSAAVGQRIVHTIQLTPQNQQLLRNIQAQISRLAALPSRNENEQTALQKLIFLQQQVIATGTPVSSSQLQNNQANNAVINHDSTLSVQATTTTHNSLLSKEITSHEKTDVSKNLSADDGDKVNNGTNSAQPYRSSAATVIVVEDSKALEQRQAAAKAEAEARNRWKKEQFDFLVKRDQDFFVEPDYRTPFSSKQDAVERLMKYHIARDRTEMDFEDFDAEFSDTAVRLLDKFAGMVAKYKTLLLKESTKEVSCAERVMVERTFCNEEKMKLEQDKLLVAQGEFPELPPPPSTWVPKLREMVTEMELNFAVNQQVQSAIDSIISCGTNDSVNVPDESEKIEYDAFGVPTSSNPSYVMGSSSSADIDEAVRSILS